MKRFKDYINFDKISKQLHSDKDKYKSSFKYFRQKRHTPKALNCIYDSGLIIGVYYTFIAKTMDILTTLRSMSVSDKLHGINLIDKMMVGVSDKKELAYKKFIYDSFSSMKYYNFSTTIQNMNIYKLKPKPRLRESLEKCSSKENTLANIARGEQEDINETAIYI